MKQIILAICLVASFVFLCSCGVHSKYTTRSHMTPEELKAFESKYAPVEETSTEEKKIEPFLKGIDGPAVRVNGRDIPAKDIRELYEYLSSYKREDAVSLKRQAVMEWIQTYAVMTQWPDKIEPAIKRLNSIHQLIQQGGDFRNIIIENSQEPLADKTGGELRSQNRGDLVPIFEMHAMTAPLNKVSEPFPTIFGWHLAETLSRDETDPAKPSFTVRHLLLFHGLDPTNGDLIRQNAMRWTNLAKIELLQPELTEILPQYVKNPKSVNNPERLE